MRAIETNKLTKSYGKTRGIIELDLSVDAGEFFGFIGPNGAGKSTTIRTLLGLIHPTSGNATILGNDILEGKKEILENIGYLPSEAMFYSGMTVAQVVKFSADLRKLDCRGEAGNLCQRLKLDTARRVDELSFGNRKKVGIVCALQHNPKLLILDEPTSGLDPLMQREFFEILKERNSQGTTVFLSSHILSEIQHNCTRAAIIRQGRIIACDKVENLSKASAKKVTIHGDCKLNDLEGVANLQQGNDNSSFLFSGDVNQLISKLSQNSIQDLTISEPDLEEVFMHFYADGGEE